MNHILTERELLDAANLVMESIASFEDAIDCIEYHESQIRHLKAQMAAKKIIYHVAVCYAVDDIVRTRMNAYMSILNNIRSISQWRLAVATVVRLGIVSIPSLIVSNRRRWIIISWRFPLLIGVVRRLVV